MPQQTEARRQPGQRGAQKKATKVSTTIRIDPDVLEAFKADGPGWQSRINAALHDWLAKRPSK